MATSSVPIKRLELEFIPSNVTSFDYLVKINMIRTPGLAGSIEFLTLSKYVIDKNNSSFFDDYGYLLNYIGNSVYMSENIFMGGIDPRTYTQDYASVEIRSARLDDFKFLLDFVIDDEDIVMYALEYRYKGVSYSTPLVLSYRPIESKPLNTKYGRPCITHRNLRFRGPNESNKYTDNHKEMYCDIRRLNSIYDELTSSLETNIEELDDLHNSLYNSIDTMEYIKNELLEA